MTKSFLPRMLCGIIILLLAQPPLVFATTNHGLFWGVEEGDRIDYMASKCFINSGDEHLQVLDFYIIVNELSPIIDNVTDISDVTLNSVESENLTSFLKNDTLMEEVDAPWVQAYPVGNWSLIQQLCTDATWWIEGYEEWEWIDTDTEWGFIYNRTSIAGVITEDISIYSKADGLSNYRAWIIHDTDDFSQIQSYFKITRRGNNPVDAYIPLMLASVGIIVVIVAVFLKRRKS